MKKANRKPSPSAEPSAVSLREMPALDSEDYRVRKNPYAARIAREGILILHDRPSSASLSEMPEADFSRARVRRSPYASRLADALSKVQYGRGRPPSASEGGSTVARSLRLPVAMWEALTSEAREKHTTVHALLRELVVIHLERRLRGHR